MLSRPQSRLLLCVFALLALAQASWFDGLNNLLQRHEERAIVDIPALEPSSSVAQKPNGPATAATDDSKSAPASPTPSPPKSTSKAAPPSSTPPATSSAAQPTSTPPTTSDNSDTATPTSTPDSSSTPESTDPAKTTPASTPTQSVKVITQISTISGSAVVQLSTSTNTDAAAATTNPASLANGGSKSSGGMDSKTKKTVIGVVVGVGGAIILAGLGAVAWRIWGRKRKDDDNDDLMGYRASSAGGEKPSAPGQAANPFQSTLESYHNPTKNVNASSNF